MKRPPAAVAEARVLVAGPGIFRQRRRLTHRTIAVALTILMGAVLLPTYGNYIGGQ